MLLHLLEEPGHKRTKDEWVVGLSVVIGQPDAARAPQIPLPAVQVPGSGPNIKEDDVWTTLNQPAAKVHLHVEEVRAKNDTNKNIYTYTVCVCVKIQNELNWFVWIDLVFF